MLKDYENHLKERLEQGIPPLPLDAEQVANLVELIKNPPEDKGAFLLDLITNRVPAGVDEAAYIKAAFLNEIALGSEKVSLIDRSEATRLLGTMLGGYNIEPLVKLLEDDEVGDIAVNALSNTLLAVSYTHLTLPTTPYV